MNVNKTFNDLKEYNLSNIEWKHGNGKALEIVIKY